MRKHHSPHDLRHPIPPEVRENQGYGAGHIAEIDGLREQFYLQEDLFLGARLVRRVGADLNWFENLVQHAPTVGAFYEALLRDVLTEIKLGELSVGTGFVYDIERRKPSPQLDVIVYKDREKAPFYRKREFVVVSSEMVVSAAEIKKKLTLADVRNVVQSTVNFHFGTHRHSPCGLQFINVFAFSSATKTTTIAGCIQEELSHHLRKFQARTVSGEAAVLFALYITLPRVYFFDRSEFIEASIRPSDNFGTYTVQVSVLRAAVDQGSGLNEFLSSMLPDATGNDLQPDLRSSPLRHTEHELTVAEPLRLAQKVSMRELAKKIPKDLRALKDVEVDGERPYAAFVPPELDWSNIPDLETLVRTPGFSWATAPIQK